MAKDSLLKGTLILALAAFVARFLGMAQRVPLKHILGDAGGAVYGVANTWYLALLPIATAGIPSALSKLISEKTALGREAEANRILRASLWFAVVAGLVITIPLYACAGWIADVSRVPDAALSIRAIAPALLLFPIIAMLRGYFQGRQSMMPGGISQIVEQIMRVVTSIGIAGLFLGLGYSVAWQAAGASLGGIFGSIGALAIMLVYLRQLRRMDRRDTAKARQQTAASDAGYGGNAAAGAAPMTLKQIYAQLLKLSIPLSLFSAAVQLVYLVDSTLGVPLLQGQLGAAAAQEQLGVLLIRAQALAGIPVIFAVAISQSLVPVISSAYARRDLREVGDKASQALRLGIFTGVPVIAAIAIGAKPINHLLFNDTNGTVMIALLTVGTIFQITMMTSGAILTGLGRMRALVVNVLLALAVKLLGSVILSAWFGIEGMVVATMLGFAAATALNVYFLGRWTPMRLFGRKWLGLTATVVAMSAVGYGMFALCDRYVKLFGNFLDYALQTALVCGVVLALYPAMLALTRVVTKEDIALFPAPVRKLIGRGARLLGR